MVQSRQAPDSFFSDGARVKKSARPLATSSSPATFVTVLAEVKHIAAVREGEHSPRLAGGAIRTCPFHTQPEAPIFQAPPARVAMAINGHRNKSFGPGGGTRRLHPSPLQKRRASAGAK